MGLSDSRPGTPQGYVFPWQRWGKTPSLPGLPGSSVNLSVRAVPSHPGEPVNSICLLLRQQC
jgi:hypothetical protein